jgi:DNA recombination protein RmuC
MMTLDLFGRPWTADMAHLVLGLIAIVGLFALFRLFGQARSLVQARAELNDLRVREGAAQAALKTEQALNGERQRTLEEVKGERLQLAQKLDTAERMLGRFEASEAERTRAMAQERENLLKMKEEVDKTFQVLATQTLKGAQAQFLELANETMAKHNETAQGGLKSLIEPVQMAFGEFKKKVDEIEKVRNEDRAQMGEQIRAIGEAMGETRAVTSNLVRALSAPKGGGRWGEETLRNVLEMAGLSSFVDYSEQVHVGHEEGRDRPDATIRLPGGRMIIIDAKASTDEYLKAAETSDPDARAVHLTAHARHVKDNVRRLATKEYWSRVPDTVDFVAMFIPGENFFAAAVGEDRDLFDFAVRNKVIIVTPSTLVALAKAVAFGWRQEQSTQNAKEAAELGKQLYERLAVMAGHIEKLGKSLNGSVRDYNGMVASLERRVLPTARRFEDLKIAGDAKAIPARLELVEAGANVLTAEFADTDINMIEDEEGAERRDQV